MSASRIDYQWHPRVHQEWRGEHLYFWRLAFAPTYDAERIVPAICSVLDLHRVTDYTLYELYAGGFDIFLRMWLPTSQGAFEHDLHEALSSFHVAASPFFVNRIIVHWPWESNPGALDVRDVDAAALRRQLSDSEIERINMRKLSTTEREKYEDQNLIAPLRRKKGVKFFTVVSANQQSLTHYATRRLEQRIKDVLSEAGSIEEKSLYGGFGFGQYLIMGRVRDFFSIARELTEPLNRAVDPTLYGARTTTYPVSRQDFLASNYYLRTGDEPIAPLTAEEALELDESQTLEVKGSAFVGIDRWLRGDGKLEPDERIVDDGILKAVTGLLNAEGGTVLLGAIERGRFDDDPKLAKDPRHGQYVVIGIDRDKDGSDADKYARRLRSLFESRIKPDPNSWIQVAPTSIAERNVCLITVRAPEHWCYHYPHSDPRPRFWVRQGNRTVELVGPEIDIYRTDRQR